MFGALLQIFFWLEFASALTTLEEYYLIQDDLKVSLPSVLINFKILEFALRRHSYALTVLRPLF